MALALGKASSQPPSAFSVVRAIWPKLWPKLRVPALAERSRETTGNLAVVLSAVTMDVKMLKAWLFDAQARLERTNIEFGHLKALLRTVEAEL